MSKYDIKGDIFRDHSQRRFLAQCKRGNTAATLFRMVTTLFQHSNVVLRKKWSLRIVPCNTTGKEWNYAIYTTFVPLRIMEEIQRFHMTSWRPFWCSKTMKRRQCWWSKQVLLDLNSFLRKRFLLFQ